MKSLLLTIAIIISFSPLFAANNLRNLETVDTPLTALLTEDINEDEYCFTVTLTITATQGPFYAGTSVELTACGETPMEAWNNLLNALK